MSSIYQFQQQNALTKLFHYKASEMHCLIWVSRLLLGGVLLSISRNVRWREGAKHYHTRNLSFKCIFWKTLKIYGKRSTDTECTPRTHISYSQRCVAQSNGKRPLSCNCWFAHRMRLPLSSLHLAALWPLQISTGELPNSPEHFRRIHGNWEGKWTLPFWWQKHFFPWGKIDFQRGSRASLFWHVEKLRKKVRKGEIESKQ